MTEDFVLKEVCDIKHKEVNALKENIEKLTNRFDKFNLWLIGVLVALVLNLVSFVVKS